MYQKPSVKVFRYSLHISAQTCLSMFNMFNIEVKEILSTIQYVKPKENVKDFTHTVPLLRTNNFFPLANQNINIVV